MAFTIKENGRFKYIDEGEGEVLLLLHGLFGALSNWEYVINEFKKDFRVIIPLMPIYDMPLRSASVEGLATFIEDFVKFKDLSNLTLLGNSLGGHIALVYALKNEDKVSRIVLTGSINIFINN